MKRNTLSLRRSRVKFARQRGVAMATVLALTLVLALLAGAILFSTQMETVAAANFSFTTRGVYVSDAGLEEAINWFENTYQPYQNNAAFNTTSVPVLYNGNPVVLDAVANQNNYPDQTMVSAFQTAFGTGSGVNVHSAGGVFWLKAVLDERHMVTGFVCVGGLGAGCPGGMQGPQQIAMERWRLISKGSWTAGSTALSTITLTAYAERASQPLTNYAIFSDSKTCNSMSLSGTVTTDSFDSSLGSYSATAQTTQGDIGSNGNIYITGSTTVDGMVHVPGGAVGPCGSPAGDVTLNGGAITYKGVANLTTPVNYPMPLTNPMAPSPYVPTTNTPATCTGNNVNGNGASTSPCLLPGVYYGDISTGSQNGLVLQGGTGGNTNTYYVNSISETGQGSIVIVPPGPVVINVIGNGNASPINLTGGSIVNNNSTAANCIVNYAGTGTVSLRGASNANLLLYAPAANVQMVGTSGIYGAIIGGTVANNGTPAVHFDRALRNTTLIVGQEEIVSWNRTIN